MPADFLAWVGIASSPPTMPPTVMGALDLLGSGLDLDLENAVGDLARQHEGGNQDDS